jgi:hypothetical protein
MTTTYSPATASVTARIVAAVASVCTTLTLLHATLFIAATEAAKPADNAALLAQATTPTTPTVR